MLEKYKICPVCGKKNYPGLIECIDCEQDLTQVRITDDETEKNAAACGVLVRVCDNCGTKNPSNARKCVGCGEDIADIIPTPDTDTPKKEIASEMPRAETRPSEQISLGIASSTESEPIPAPSPAPSPAMDMPATVLNTAINRLCYTVTLTTPDGGYSYTMTGERAVLGRSEEASDYLSTKPYVSRVHCALIITEEGVFCEDLNNTNYTFINNTRAVGRVKLENGDTLALGGLTVGGNRQTNAAYFTVTIR